VERESETSHRETELHVTQAHLTPTHASDAGPIRQQDRLTQSRTPTPDATRDKATALSREQGDSAGRPPMRSIGSGEPRRRRSFAPVLPIAHGAAQGGGTRRRPVRRSSRLRWLPARTRRDRAPKWSLDTPLPAAVRRWFRTLPPAASLGRPPI